MNQTTSSSLKVYELAKELGMDSFGLLDVLKKIGVEVKSHMSSLEIAQVAAAKDFLHRQSAAGGAAKNGAKGGAKKVTTRKAAASGAGAGGTASSTASPSASTRSRAKVIVPEVAPTRAKVIKRRSPKEEEETTAPNLATPAPEFIPSADLDTVPTTEYKEDSSDEPVTMASESEETNVAASAVSAPKSEEPLQPTNPAASTAKKVAPPVADPRTARPAPRPSQNLMQEDEMIDRSFTQRKLKIIQNAPPPSAAPANTDAKNADAAAKDRNKKPADPYSSSGKGMFKPVTSVIDAGEEEQRRKNNGTANRNPEDIKVADFRKREVIFQPKRRKLPPGKVVRKTEITTPGTQKRKIRIEHRISIADLAQRMSEKPKTVAKKLGELGVEVGENLQQLLDFDTATLVAHEFKYEIENIAFNEKTLLAGLADESESLQARPPVITVMGHVDHGKTTLLDTIRNATVAAGEAGGITQHIGAYSVTVDGHVLTFLDTPGHEAFKAIRQRGTNMTDLVVLVVAADDGIMPQTIESIKIAQGANVPIIVAANKADKHDANIDRLKQMLSEHNVLVEDWGGEVPMVPVSALKKTGIKELLETIYLQAEVLELKANPNRAAEGAVIESRMQIGRGIVTDALVQRGTLRTGDIVVCGTAYGRVRAMLNDQGKSVKTVAPGFPVEFAGLNDVPEAGETFYVVKSEADAKEITEHRKEEIRLAKVKSTERKPITLEELFADDPNAGKKHLNIMLKADVFGSLEAIADSVAAIRSDKVTVKIVGKSVGVITDTDVSFAQTSKAHIFGFNVKPDAKARENAKREGVQVHSHSIIYEMLDTIKATMESLLDPIRIEKPVGKADVKQAFTVSKIGLVAGSIVSDGKITRNNYARVFRGNEQVVEGAVISLKRFKDDAREVTKGQECGIGVEKYEDIRAGDRIEAFHVEFEKAKL